MNKWKTLQLVNQKSSGLMFLTFQTMAQYLRGPRIEWQPESQNNPITSAKDKELSNLDIYQNEHSYEKQVDIPPRQRISVFQKIGVCGNIHVKTGKFQFNQTAL